MGFRYECAQVVQPVPLFWPERVWDDESGKMSPEETDRLRAAIVDSAGFDLDCLAPPPRSPPAEVKVRKVGSGRPRRPREADLPIVKVDLRRVETDSDETDFGDF
jgi:hypothetical protein